MEFTYDGIVRYGFGFFNPNHAAAFICAVLPLAWLLFLNNRLWAKILGAIASVSLIIVLSMTLSRTGMLVFALEFGAFLFYFGKGYLKYLIPLGIVFVGTLIISGAIGRIEIDNSTMNRFEIWKAGLALLSSNPFGVGLGNSGEIVSAFLLPDDINCRTLINSHLTFICEFGLLLGVVYVAFIFSVFSAGIKSLKKTKINFAVFVSFCGLVISAFLSTIFDWEVLIYPTKFEHLTLFNLLTQWLNPILFLCLGAFLLLLKKSLKLIVVSFALSIFTLCCCALLGKLQSDQILKIQHNGGDCFVKTSEGTPYSIVLFDDSFNLKRAVNILKKCGLHEQISICINSWQAKETLPKEKPKCFILFGQCADFANQNNIQQILIAPPPYSIPNNRNIKAIYIPKWDSKYKTVKKSHSNLKEF